MTKRITRYVGHLDQTTDPPYLFHTIYFRDTVDQSTAVYQATASGPVDPSAETFLEDLALVHDDTDLPVSLAP